MHIPDGFLNVPTAAGTAVLSVFGLGFALRRARKTLPPRRVPLLGLAAAFVFAAQMLNFPVAGGTSGHLVGGVLAAVLLGPSAAVIVMAAVLIVQCFIFADGGVTALGANIFNMAILATVAGYGVYRMLVRALRGARGMIAAAAFAAWCATVLGSISCAGQLAASGTVAWSVAFPTMAGVHMLIGLGEALITALVLVAVANVRPELFYAEPAEPKRSHGEFVGYGLLLALGLAVFVAPFASPWPDGLERVAVRLGFELQAVEEPLLHSPIPDYAFPGIGSAVAATALAGASGTLIVFVLSWVMSRFLVPGGKDGSSPASR